MDFPIGRLNNNKYMQRYFESSWAYYADVLCESYGATKVSDESAAHANENSLRVDVYLNRYLLYTDFYSVCEMNETDLAIQHIILAFDGTILQF